MNAPTELAPLYTPAALLDDGITALRRRLEWRRSPAVKPAAHPLRVPGKARVRRVILVVLDGLRPDAIEAFAMTNLRDLGLCGAYTGSATTVSPPVTAAAMTSLLTGAAPADHGLTSDRFHIPRPRIRLEPLPAVLDQAGLPVATFVRRLPLAFRPLARACALHLRVRTPTFAGDDARSILDAAHDTLHTQRDGLIMLHWPDADRAGHEHGWMSPAYGAACCAIDEALGDLVDATRALDDPDTLLIALADHGGGGISAFDHDGEHPLNMTIPVLMVGTAVDGARLQGEVNILDMAPTIASALGVTPPSGWPGRAHEILRQPVNLVA